jgi:hypothetical protein
MSTHTPGPWKRQFAAGAHVIRANGTSRSLAQVLHDGPEDEANAALIAAAPEMYAALVGLMRASGSLTGNPDMDYRWEAAARAAIAKAEGR